ncbi:uncharacterized protein OCT59_009198 [Rhizophagus irregularis]|uniref:uncharacterized protein n=1 Tax=Rhizophagus irregularis TaxID=588596 RepID=UPI0019FEDF58|nr:hypothetical protein OCT59_009198 [Rhizophagus irregularis]GBC24573.2 hypothetical protein PHYBLDRAFT_147994 [Rhizophagus irregularis DAOM 181602=DAOM 197198]
MFEYQSLITDFDGDTMDIVSEPQLKPGDKELVQITHDECHFYTNDGQRRIWMREDEDILCSKHQGCSIMVFTFLCPCHGAYAGSGRSKIYRPKVRKYDNTHDNQESISYDSTHDYNNIRDNIPNNNTLFYNAYKNFLYDNTYESLPPTYDNNTYYENLSYDVCLPYDTLENLSYDTYLPYDTCENFSHDGILDYDVSRENLNENLSDCNENQSNQVIKIFLLSLISSSNKQSNYFVSNVC